MAGAGVHAHLCRNLTRPHMSLLPPAVQVEDLLVVAACGPAGGGRQELPGRFLRQFALLAAPAPGEESMRAIFGAITGGCLDVHFGAQAADLRNRLLRPLVECAVDVYQWVGGPARCSPPCCSGLAAAPAWACSCTVAAVGGRCINPLLSVVDRRPARSCCPPQPRCTTPSTCATCPACSRA
jgi:hypothetical protein